MPPVARGHAGPHRIFNHRWDDPATFATLGTIPAREIAELTGGRLTQDVPVALNRLVTEYDHVLICGPVFPHEVAGFSGQHPPIKPHDLRGALKSIWDVYSEFYAWIDPEETDEDDEDEDEDDE